MDDVDFMKLLDLPQQGRFVFVYDRENADLKMMGILRRAGVEVFANGNRMIWLELR